MLITVDKTKNLRDLEEEFSGAFPYLKLEFLGASARPDERKTFHPNGATIGAINANAESTVYITGDMTITALKEIFSERFGLAVQVMRRFGNTWVKTTVTDGWTLSEQNKQGERLALNSR